jgi:hypothetical protein
MMQFIFDANLFGKAVVLQPDQFVIGLGNYSNK